MERERALKLLSLFDGTAAAGDLSRASRERLLEDAISTLKVCQTHHSSAFRKQKDLNQALVTLLFWKALNELPQQPENSLYAQFDDFYVRNERSLFAELPNKEVQDMRERLSGLNFQPFTALSFVMANDSQLALINRLLESLTESFEPLASYEEFESDTDQGDHFEQLVESQLRRFGLASAQEQIMKSERSQIALKLNQLSPFVDTRIANFPESVKLPDFAKTLALTHWHPASDPIFIGNENWLYFVHELNWKVKTTPTHLPALTRYVQMRPEFDATVTADEALEELALSLRSLSNYRCLLKLLVLRKVVGASNYIPFNEVVGIESLFDGPVAKVHEYVFGRKLAADSLGLQLNFDRYLIATFDRLAQDIPLFRFLSPSATHSALEYWKSPKRGFASDVVAVMFGLWHGVDSADFYLEAVRGLSKHVAGSRFLAELIEACLSGEERTSARRTAGLEAELAQPPSTLKVDSFQKGAKEEKRDWPALILLFLDDLKTDDFNIKKSAFLTEFVGRVHKSVNPTAPAPVVGNFARLLLRTLEFCTKGPKPSPLLSSEVEGQLSVI